MSQPDADRVERKLQQVLGDGGWLTGDAHSDAHVMDRRGTQIGRAMGVALPASTEQVAEVLRICNEAMIGVVPQGGNTGRCGGAIPDETGDQIVLSLRRMNRIRAVAPLENTLSAEAGCILAEVKTAAAAEGRLFPLSLGAEGSCQIGGNLATNAGGTNVLRYGNARELALGLEVVLPDGRVWDGMNRLRKNNTGYDLRDLFVGSEGTLGVITAAVLKLFPQPTSMSTAMAALARLEHALELLARLRAATGDRVETFEFLSRTALEFATSNAPGCRDPFQAPHSWYVLLEISSYDYGDAAMEILEQVLASALQDGLLANAVIAASDAQRRSLWRLRHGVVEAQAAEGASIKHDVSVPLSALPEFLLVADQRVALAQPGVRPCAFGHLGDGNIHYNLSQPRGADPAVFLAQASKLNRICYDLVAELGGSFSAEHGIGRIKVDAMSRYKSPLELEMMTSVKRIFDPNGIMNPGKVLPHR